MLKISVVIPSYNQGNFIEETIESVIKVLSANDELIIADAGSTDDTKQRIERYLCDPRIIWNSETDKGFSDGLNKIFDRINGDIIGIMSSDDVYLDCSFDRIRNLFEDPDLNLVFADYKIIDASGRQIGKRSLTKISTIEEIFSLKIAIPQSSTFFRRISLKKQLPLSLDYDYIADIAIFNRICHDGKWLQFSEYWSAVRRHPGSRTGKKNPGIQYLQFLKREFPELAAKPIVRSGAILLTARYLAESGHTYNAVTKLFESFLSCPLATLKHWLFARTLLRFLPASILVIIRTITGSR